MLTGSLSMPTDFQVQVNVTNNRGFTPEEIAEKCASQIINISDNAHPAIQEQARAFQNELIRTITRYIKEAVTSDRTTVYNALTDAGHPKLAELIRRL
jgi:hypothetical protein